MNITKNSGIIFIFLFTLYCSLFTVLSGCGKNPVLGYLPEQKAANTSGGSGTGTTVTTPTLNVVLGNSTYPGTTTSNSITIQTGTNPIISWKLADNVTMESSDKSFNSNNANTFDVWVYNIKSDSSGLSFDNFWGIYVSTDVKSVTYGNTSFTGLQVTYISPKTLTKGTYTVRVEGCYRTSTGGWHGAWPDGNGTIKVE
jgi:hypothetical protein